MMKRIIALLMTLMMLLTAASAQTSRDTTLLFAYGEEAFTLHMLDMPNTITYDGHAWLLEHDSISFEGQFMMYGGNTRTVHEMSVPQFRLDEIAEGESLYLGSVFVTPPSKMTLYVFSGDHFTGSYTLVDYLEGPYYELPLRVTRNEAGDFVLTDLVFLYTYMRDGEQVYLASTFYIDYEGYAGAPASRAQINGSVTLPEVSPNEGVTRTPVTPIKQTNTGSNAQTSELESELEAQRAYIAELEIAVSTRDARIAGLEEQVANYETMVPQLTADTQLLQQTVTEQEGSIAELQTANAALQAQCAELQTQNTALTGRITELERELAFYKGTSSSIGSMVVGQFAQQPTDYSTMTDEELLARRAELEAEMAMIDAALAD